MKLQSDPNEYVDFVRYVSNPKKYKEKIADRVEETVNKKTWDLIKGGNSLSRNTGTKANDTKSNQSYQGPKFDYKSILQNNKS